MLIANAIFATATRCRIVWTNSHSCAQAGFGGIAVDIRLNIYRPHCASDTRGKDPNRRCCRRGRRR